MKLEKLSKEVKEELISYTKNTFAQDVHSFEVPKDEPFIETFKQLIEEIKRSDIESVLNEAFSYGDEKIKFENPSDVSLEIYNSMAGNIPIFYIKNTNDFEELITKVVNKGKKDPNIKNTGASFVHGKDIRFIILSNKPYSNVPASELGLDDETWQKYSMVIRREHECTHYFTKRFLGSTKNNIHDELIADFAGIVSAHGCYEPKWFLCGLGIDKFPESQPIRRFPVYTKSLSDKALDALKGITIEASNNVKRWSETEHAKDLTLTEKILFLTSKDLFELSELY